MKLTAKLVSMFLVGVVLLAGLRIYLEMAHEQREFEEEVAAEVEHLGSALEEIVTVMWREHGGEGAIRLIQENRIGDARFSLRWVYFDASREDPHCPAVPSDVIRAILRDQRPSPPVRGPDGVMYVHSYWPVSVDDPRRGGFEISKAITELRQNKVDAMLRNAWVTTAMAALAVLLVTVVGVRLVGRPVQELVEKTRRIAAGDLSGPVQLKSRDEFRELADSINDMCAQLGASQERLRKETTARIQAMEQLRHADRLRTVGRLAAGIAHELGTPLNVVSGRAGLIVSGKLAGEDVTKSAGTIKAEAERMTGIIRQLLDFARRNTPRRTAVDLRQVTAGTVDLLAGIAKKRNVEVIVEPADTPLMANVDVGQFQQVLTNLIMNAVQAMPQGGAVHLAVNRARAISPYQPDAGEAEFVCISVKDAGEGIAAEHLDQVFEPFFTTKDVGEGTGLGLSIAYGIVQEHGGWIDVASETGQGTCFFVYVPQESQV